MFLQERTMAGGSGSNKTLRIWDLSKVPRSQAYYTYLPKETKKKFEQKFPAFCSKQHTLMFDEICVIFPTDVPFISQGQHTSFFPYEIQRAPGNTSCSLHTVVCVRKCRWANPLSIVMTGCGAPSVNYGL